MRWIAIVGPISLILTHTEMLMTPILRNTTLIGIEGFQMTKNQVWGSPVYSKASLLSTLQQRRPWLHFYEWLNQLLDIIWSTVYRLSIKREARGRVQQQKVCQLLLLLWHYTAEILRSSLDLIALLTMLAPVDFVEYDDNLHWIVRVRDLREIGYVTEIDGRWVVLFSRQRDLPALQFQSHRPAKKQFNEQTNA